MYVNCAICIFFCFLFFCNCWQTSNMIWLQMLNIDWTIANVITRKPIIIGMWSLCVSVLLDILRFDISLLLVLSWIWVYVSTSMYINIYVRFCRNFRYVVYTHKLLCFLMIALAIHLRRSIMRNKWKSMPAWTLKLAKSFAIATQQHYMWVCTCKSFRWSMKRITIKRKYILCTPPRDMTSSNK